MKTRIIYKDWFAGLVIILILLVFSRSDFISSLERNAYDIGVNISSRNANDKIAIIAIDDKSIDAIGRFPWPRDVHAKLYDILADSGSRVIGQTAFFPEPQIDPGLKYIRELKQSFNNSELYNLPELVETLEAKLATSHARLKNKNNRDAQKALKGIADVINDSQLLHRIPEHLQSYLDQLDSAEENLDTDLKLSDSIQNTGNIIFNIPAIYGQPIGNPDTPLPDYISRFRINENNVTGNSNADDKTPISVVEMKLPIASLGERARSIGITIPTLDIDGAMRSEALIIDYYDDYFPSMALMLAASSLNLDRNDIKVNAGTDVELGRLKIKTDSQSLIRPFFYKSRSGESKSTFTTDSFSDVLQGYPQVNIKIKLF